MKTVKSRSSFKKKPAPSDSPREMLSVPVPRKRRSRRTKPPSFGDLCEMSGGLAAVWRRNGCTNREIVEFMDDEPFILCDVVPLLHRLGFTEDDVVRHVPHDTILARIVLEFMTIAVRGTRRSVSSLAVPPWMLVSFLRRALTRRIATMKNKATRNVHYEAEKLRRREMAAERRRIARRTTTAPCPSPEALLDAWRHVRDSKEALVRFGSMMQDLECYVDNSLRFDHAGRIVGRNAGVKGWLRDNLPELAEHYTSVIRYKAAAKKLRQIVGLADPTPVAMVLGTVRPSQMKAKEEGYMCNYGAEKHVRNTTATRAHENAAEWDGGTSVNAEQGVTAKQGVTAEQGVAAEQGGRTEYLTEQEKRTREAGKDISPPVEVVRARAVYLEVMDGVPDVAAQVLARIDALCDPERTDEAATLRSWREKYQSAITVRRKDSWWRRMTA